ncbi:hypothetical protein CISG_07699 [Coccidioides immitis RMSCC 3703]|uniref:Uncharacterized protein n=2 Tax=Coccidioides immitis TaxID=5501 RepID=A0A0J8R6B4_COCIT|nr:hypothetical protein CIRG_02887 [Coccidioides immitis RMSCC 2394]KMU79268.1 hypothetical protein CISG_07699 [Coccidioides immitis RMSCC 3703]
MKRRGTCCLPARRGFADRGGKAVAAMRTRGRLRHRQRRSNSIVRSAVGRRTSEPKKTKKGQQLKTCSSCSADAYRVLGEYCLRRRAAPDMQLQPAAASLGATMFLPGAAQRRMDRIQAEIIIKRFSCRLATG